MQKKERSSVDSEQREQRLIKEQIARASAQTKDATETDEAEVGAAATAA